MIVHEFSLATVCAKRTDTCGQRSVSIFEVNGMTVNAGQWQSERLNDGQSGRMTVKAGEWRSERANYGQRGRRIFNWWIHCDSLLSERSPSNNLIALLLANSLFIFSNNVHCVCLCKLVCSKLNMDNQTKRKLVVPQ